MPNEADPRSGRKTSREDIPTPHAIPLDWHDSAARAATLEKMFEAVCRQHFETIDWYYGRKNSKRKVAQRLRTGSIWATTLGAAGLVFTASMAGQPQSPILGLGSSLAMVLAGGLMAHDRFFGYSASWIRFVMTGLEAERSLTRFNREWNQQVTTAAGDVSLELARDQHRYRVLCTAVERLQAIVQAEAQEWANQFSQNLKKSVSDLARELEQAQQIGNRPGAAGGEGAVRALRAAQPIAGPNGELPPAANPQEREAGG